MPANTRMKDTASVVTRMSVSKPGCFTHTDGSPRSRMSQMTVALWPR